MASAPGSKNGRSVLTEESVKEIIEHLREGIYDSNTLAKMYGCSQPTIINIKSNRIWKHISRERIKTRTKELRNLSDDQVRSIRKKLADGQRVCAIAREFGIHPSGVSHIKTGRNYRNVK